MSLGRASTLPVNADYVLAPQAAGGRVHLGRFVGIEDDLGLAVAVAQVDEHELAVVAVSLDPAAEGGRLADIRRTQFTARLCTQHQDIPRFDSIFVSGCHWRLDRQWLFVRC